jgi:hypothetical protein
MSKRRPRRTINWRGTPDPPSPKIIHVPGLAQQMLTELAPLLAEDGYYLDEEGVLNGPDTDDLPAFQAALDRAVARHNLAQSTPVGAAHENTCTTLRLAVQAIALRHPRRCNRCGMHRDRAELARQLAVGPPPRRPRRSGDSHPPTCRPLDRPPRCRRHPDPNGSRSACPKRGSWFLNGRLITEPPAGEHCHTLE